MSLTSRRDRSSEKAGVVVRSTKRMKPSSIRTSRNSRRMVSSTPFGVRRPVGGPPGFGAGSGVGVVPCDSGTVNRRRRLMDPSASRSTSTRGRQDAALRAVACFGQSKSMPFRSMRSTRIAGRLAPDSRISTFWALSWSESMRILTCLQVDAPSSIPVRRRLTEQLKHALGGGSLPPDQALPQHPRAGWLPRRQDGDRPSAALPRPAPEPSGSRKPVKEDES